MYDKPLDKYGIEKPLEENTDDLRNKGLGDYNKLMEMEEGGMQLPQKNREENFDDMQENMEEEPMLNRINKSVKNIKENRRRVKEENENAENDELNELNRENLNEMEMENNNNERRREIIDDE